MSQNGRLAGVWKANFSGEIFVQSKGATAAFAWVLSSAFYLPILFFLVFPRRPTAAVTAAASAAACAWSYLHG